MPAGPPQLLYRPTVHERRQRGGRQYRRGRPITRPRLRSGVPSGVVPRNSLSYIFLCRSPSRGSPAGAGTVGPQLRRLELSRPPAAASRGVGVGIRDITSDNGIEHRDALPNREEAMRSRLPMLVTGAILATSAGMLPLARRSGLPGPGPAVAAAAVLALAPATSAARVAASGKAGDARQVHVDSALAALAPRVSRLSDPAALRLAFNAYYAFQAAHPEQVRKPYLYFVDYGLNNRTPRGWVFDMASLSVVDGPFTVAAGRGSHTNADGVPMHFSNASGSMASSLGLFVAGSEYGFTGRTGGHPYGSTGMRLEGVSGRFNDLAGPRRVVVHGAPYVTPAKAGRSEGCPAMEPARARRLIPLLADGGLVFLYSPNDTAWLHQDPWANLPALDTTTTATPPAES